MASKELQGKFAAQPRALFRMIVRAKGDLGEAEARLRQAGLHPVRRINLINAVVAEGAGSQWLAVAKAAWIAGLDEDKQVRAL